MSLLDPKQMMSPSFLALRTSHCFSLEIPRKQGRYNHRSSLSGVKAAGAACYATLRRERDAGALGPIQRCPFLFRLDLSFAITEAAGWRFLERLVTLLPETLVIMEGYALAIANDDAQPDKLKALATGFDRALNTLMTMVSEAVAER